MSVWRLVPIRAGVHIIVRVFAGADVDHVVEVGELLVCRDDFGDLAARLGAPQAFDTRTGEPLPVRSSDLVPAGPLLKPADWGRTPPEGGIS